MQNEWQYGIKHLHYKIRTLTSSDSNTQSRGAGMAFTVLRTLDTLVLAKPDGPASIITSEDGPVDSSLLL